MVLRTVLGLVVGMMISVLVISANDVLNFLLHRPAGTPGLDDLPKFAEWSKEFQSNQLAVHAYLESLPTAAFVIVLCGWQLGAFVGGAVAALIAGRARVIHAGIIGGFVLLGTVINFLSVRDNANFTHPDWMIVAGLLLPLPVSLIAGKLVARWRCPRALPPVPPS